MEDLFILLIFGLVATIPVLLVFGYVWLSSPAKRSITVSRARHIRSSRMFRNVILVLIAITLIWLLWRVAREDDFPLGHLCMFLGISFGGGWLLSQQRVALYAALLWFAAWPYNEWILANCSGDCSIRVDAILVLPLLLFFSIKAFISIIREVLRWEKAPHART